jgi:hypothetical protein
MLQGLTFSIGEGVIISLLVVIIVLAVRGK